MARAYIRVVADRAARQAWRTVIAHSWQALATKLASTGLLLLLAFAYVQRTTSVTDDQLFSDQATIVALAAAAAAILVFGVFLVQLLFVAPYQLWREEKDRADQAEAIARPSGSKPERAAKFDEAVLALRHLVNARELWWHHEHRSDIRSHELPDRLAGAINEI